MLNQLLFTFKLVTLKVVLFILSFYRFDLFYFPLAFAICLCFGLHATLILCWQRLHSLCMMSIIACMMTIFDRF